LPGLAEGFDTCHDFMSAIYDNSKQQLNIALKAIDEHLSKCHTTARYGLASAREEIEKLRADK